MKQKCHSIALLFLLLLSIITSQSSARKLTHKHGEVDVHEINNISNNNNKESFTNMESIISFDKLMGLEEESCENEDEECLKRRAIAEAHLDYIYTQHHNKP